ncbi:hypothetical protein GS532_22700 [Rhodococcus hoagii]|nr:hypothetical protein [Prescottella equi]
MVVQVDDTLFPDIHEVLMAYLAPLGETDTEPPDEDDQWRGIQIIGSAATMTGSATTRG